MKNVKLNRVIVVDTDESEISVHEAEQVTVVILINDTEGERHVTCRVRLVGTGAHAEIIGIVVGDSDSEISLHTEQMHEAAQTSSRLLVRSVLAGNANFQYDGMIRVEKNAQKTDAYQRNENLLLSSTARASSKPTLEILANDVRCTHGATVGKLPKEQMWYLETRGIGQDMARQLIVEGFLESAILKIPDTMVQEKIRSILWQTL